MPKIVRLILGDQLSRQIPSLENCDKAADIVMLCEVWEEATYVRHHQKKIAFLFSAMRHFAQELRAEGYNVHYTTLNDPENAGTFKEELKRIVTQYKASEVVVTSPGEYRVLQDMLTWETILNIRVSIKDDSRFLCTPFEFREWAGDRKNLRMEFFYREMRKKYGILMAGPNQPEGGDWNYDSQNRKIPNQSSLFLPQLPVFANDAITQDVLTLVAERFGSHFGDLEPFNFAVTRQDALKVLDSFITDRLPLFGDYQDAMVQGQPVLYHAQISFYLNCGLLDPLEVVRAAEHAYHSKKAPLNAVEGFIRQIIGWREYMRGIYWLRMPEFAQENYLEASRRLPWFYWDAKTDMNCLHQCVTETRQNAYAHHIQRLMVLGNFALLAGIDPKDVNEWYLIVYADAYEWVELPNVHGMILFADGGFLGSKPYAASGAYINKMSNYCKGCRYDVNKKSGADACPFNYLYWNFMLQNRAKLEGNPRLGFTFKTLNALSADKAEQVLTDADLFLNSL